MLSPVIISLPITERFISETLKMEDIKEESNGMTYAWERIIETNYTCAKTNKQTNKKTAY